MGLIKKIFNKYNKLFALVISCFIIAAFAVSIFIICKLSYNAKQFEVKNLKLEERLKITNKALSALKAQDQYKINKALESKIASIESSYKQTAALYENLSDLKITSSKTGDFDKQFADILSLLSKQNYASAESQLSLLDTALTKEQDRINALLQPVRNVVSSNSPPGSGYQIQQVSTDLGSFTVEIIAADLNSTRVIVDTASNSDCSDNCPVLSLYDFVSRNSAFAGINGSFFCPSDYPSCAGKSNSFDTLLMNKNKIYFNSSNNVYSTVPAAVFSGNSARFVTESLQWGRDTGADSVIANHPLLTLNGQINLAGNTGEAKLSQKTSRSFVGSTGNTVYIGVVFNATVTEEAKVMNSLGIQNSLNLDDGGSTALWYNGYKAGPGRNIPNALLLIHK